MTRKFLHTLIFFLLSANLFSQGLTCETSEPFCTGTIYTFPAGTTGQAQPGANYGCLLSQPCPAWYHMLVDQPGPISIYMYSTPLHDIDFICWGPFTDPYEPCVTGLTANKIVSCSYSPLSYETCYIPNGQTGEYYILLITNYSQQPCNITFSQNGGTGSTDCTILPPPVSNNGPLCVGQTLHLYADDIPNASYWWTGPNGFLSAIQNPSIPNVTLANAGDYACTITVNGQSSDPAITNVVIHDLPNTNLLSGDTIACIGTPAYLIFHFNGFGPYSITYSDDAGPHTVLGLSPPQDTVFVYPTQPTTYNITKVADNFCSRTLLGMSVDVDTYPYTSAELSGTANICGGDQASLTFSLQGEPPWSITYTQNGSNPQTVVANTSPYILNVNPAATTLYEMSSVEDVNCYAELTGDALITVKPTPSANAGTDQTIAYGTSTQLSGQASGGSGSWQISWEPANKLVDPTVLQPTTVLLTETTLFTLTVTDDDGGCQGTDDVLVTITGGPLGAFPTAQPPVICLGESSQLSAMATGGSGNYTYLWSSSPSGFSSDIPNPTVSPTQTTTYNLIVEDGFNTLNSSVVVTVNPLPLPDAGADQTIAHGTSTQLNGSASGSQGPYSYHWEPASKVDDPNIANPHTTNLYNTTLFTLTVTDQTTGCTSADAGQMTVVVSGDALSANPTADPEQICLGESTTLHALAGGGSGNYTYTWTASGFSSGDANPVVSPQQTTIYSVVVDDGYNTANASVAVTVYPIPLVHLGPPDTVVCVYDTLTLNAGNPGASYQWSNGSTDQTVKVGTTGIGFDSKTFNVTVTNENGCESVGNITVYFDFSACQGISENNPLYKLHIYPNPTKGIVNIDMKDYKSKLSIAVTDIYGKLVLKKELSSAYSDELVRLDLSALPAGMYFLRINGENGLTRSDKLVISN